MRAGSPWKATRSPASAIQRRRAAFEGKSSRIVRSVCSDVRRIAREGGPAERALPLAEEWPDVERDEADDLERVRDAGLDGARPQVVAVVERDGAAPLEGEHRPHVRPHRPDRAPPVFVGVGGAEAERLRVRKAVRNVAIQLVVRGRLVRQDIRDDPAREEALEEVHRVDEDADRDGLAGALRREGPVDRGVQVVDPDVEVTRREALLDPGGVHLGHEGRPAAHRHRQRLGAAHAAQTRCHGEPARERSVRRPEVPPGGRRERLVRALEDPLRADVDPRPRRHLSVHRQTEGLEAPEFIPGPPFRHQIRVGNEDARRVGMRPENADRLAGLDEQRLVRAEASELPEDRLEALGVPGRLSRAAVDDEVLPPLGHLRVEVVEQHPVRGFRQPRAAAQGGPFREGRWARTGGAVAGHRGDVSAWTSG